MPPLAAFFDTSGVAAALRNGSGRGVHMVLVGDSKTYGDNIRNYPSGYFRELGVTGETIPFRGVVCNAGSGVSDSHSRTWAGVTNLSTLIMDARPGQDLTASGGSGTFTFGETVLQDSSGASGQFLSESGGIVKVWNQGGTQFDGSGAIRNSGSTVTRNVSGVATATVDHNGFPASMSFKPYRYMLATGSISVSAIIARSDMENESLFGTPSWPADRALTARGIAYTGSGCFPLVKARSYRNTTSQNSVNVDLSATSGFQGYDLGVTSSPTLPVTLDWQAQTTADRSGQYGYFFGALIFDPNNPGLSMDYMAYGGASISNFCDTAVLSDASFAAYMAVSTPDNADTVWFVLDFGQNGAGLTKAQYKSYLIQAVARCVAATPSGKTCKVTLCAPYNTGAAHLVGKRDACYEVAFSLRHYVSFDNRYDRYSAAQVADSAFTTDGIHPQLAFSQLLAQDQVNQIRSPLIALGGERYRSRGRNIR